MSKKSCFSKICDLMRGYQTLKGDLDKNYKSMESSGRYSSRYLSDLKDTDNKRLSRERMTIAYRLDQIRDDFLKELDKDFALDWTGKGTESISTYSLEKLVHSGIEPTPQEFEKLAQQYSGSYYASRMLHDFANRCGYQLNNVPDRDECEKEFDRFCRDVRNSLEPTNALPIYVDADAARMSANSILDGMERPLMNCRPTPKTFEEKIAATAEDEQLSKARANELSPEESARMDADFTKGFWSVGNYPGHNVKQQNKLQNQIDQLSDEQRADAEKLAAYLHGTSEIGQQELDWVRSEAYAKMQRDQAAEAAAKAPQKVDLAEARQRRIDDGIAKVEKLQSEIAELDAKANPAE